MTIKLSLSSVTFLEFSNFDVARRYLLIIIDGQKY